MMNHATNFHKEVPSQSIDPDLLTRALTKAQMEQELKELECKDYSSSSESDKNGSKDSSESKNGQPEKQFN